MIAAIEAYQPERAKLLLVTNVTTDRLESYLEPDFIISNG